MKARSLFKMHLRHFISAPRLRLTLPQIIYAVPELESNIYFNNVIDSAIPGSYTVEVKCDAGTQGNSRWFWTPSPEDAGKEFSLELRVFNDLGLIASAKSKVVVAREQEVRTKKFTLALLADSGVNNRYPDHILELMRERGYTGYTPIGKHSGNGNPVVPGGVAHDGYGGFEWNCFLDRWFYSSDELPLAQSEAEREQMISFGIRDNLKTRTYLLRSPLLKLENGKKVLDIQGWLKAINQGNAPDFIIIQLGGNDMFTAEEENLNKRVKKVMANARKLISELKKHAPNAIFGIATGSCGCGQDGFGENYKCLQSGYQYRRNIQRYNTELAKLVKKLNDPKISLVPIHQAIDPEGSYIKKEYPIHARSKEKVMRFSNALHQSPEGGYQMGDAIACWIINHLKK